MRELRTQIEINAPAEKVWEHLVALDQYASWNPFITQAHGSVHEGETLSIQIAPPGGQAMTFKPKVVHVRVNREFRWLGRVLMPGLFDGEHIFEIEEIESNRLRFIQREEFSGLLVPLLWKKLNTQTRQGFEAMNQAIKQKAEEEKSEKQI